MKVSVSDLSDLDLARLLEDYFGTENLLKSETGVWYFDDLIWRKLSNEELKATATTLLAERVTKVMRNNLSNMLEVFKTYNWISNADFELGDPSIVVMADGYRAYSSGAWNKIDADRELRRRICLPASYTEARPEQFDAFLRDILCDADGRPLTDREALTELIWEMLGYCLATHTRYERCFILCGPGANGKSVLGAVAKAMVGRANTASIQPAQMGSVFQRSNLEGKLLNLVTELNQKEELQDGLLKAIVSGEMMSVERKFQEVREIEPFAKHIILTNHMPRISDYSDGLFRRVSIIPLQRQFLGASADPLLINKLTGELDAITSRALDALGRLIDRNGNFTEPESCLAAKNTWRSDNNHIMQYLAERVYETPQGSVSVKDMYDDYRNWFASTGLRGQLGRKQFANRVESAGVAKSSRRSQGYFFENVSLR
jgi:putative DNA primase/helicase